MFGSETSIGFAVELLELSKLFGESHLRQQIVDFTLDARRLRIRSRAFLRENERRVEY
jgi:hypothetical protein